MPHIPALTDITLDLLPLCYFCLSCDQIDKNKLDIS